MTFTVTYRGADGALREEALEAANRAECFAQCKARGIAPVTLTETHGQKRRATGRTGGSSSVCGQSTQQVRRPLSWRLVVGIVLIAVLVGGVWWFTHERRTGHDPQITNHASKSKPKTVKPKTTYKPTSAPTAASAATNALVVAKPKPKEQTVPARTNATIRPKFFKPTMTLEDGTVVDLRPPPAIKDPMERALAAVATPGGLAIPFAAALRRFSKLELMEMLARDVEFSNDDSEVIVEKKVAVQQVKERFREYLQAGKTLDEAIQDVDRQMRLENMQQAAAYKGLAEAVKTGDAEIVNRFVVEQNKVLKEQGLHLLSVPPQFKAEKVEQETDNKE